MIQEKDKKCKINKCLYDVVDVFYRNRRCKMNKAELKEAFDTKFEADIKALLSGYLPDDSSRDYVAFKIKVLHREYAEQEMSSSGEYY